MIDLNESDLVLVKKILKKNVPLAKTMVFGSRIKGNAKPFSDLDIAIDNGQPLDIEILTQLKNDFSDSHLTIKVDIVDWHTIDENFKTVITHKYLWLDQ